MFIQEFTKELSVGLILSDSSDSSDVMPKPEDSVVILDQNVDASSDAFVTQRPLTGDPLYPRYDMTSVYHPDPFVSTLSTIYLNINLHCPLM